MANLYSDIGQNQYDARTRADQRVANGHKVSGPLFMARATYTVTAAEADDDIIHMVFLPVGTVIFPHLSRGWEDDNITSLDFGTETNDDVFSAADDLSTDLNVALNVATTAKAAPYVVQDVNDQGGEWVIVVIETASAKTAGKLIGVDIVYCAK